MTAERERDPGGGVIVDAAGTEETASVSLDPSETPVDTDAMFHLLRSERRRRALRYLLDVDEEPVSMREVAETVAAAEYHTTVDALRSDDRQRVYITLYQSHLPQMDEAGIIEYNQDRGLIKSTPLIEQFDPYLDTDGVPTEDGPAERLWAILAGGGLGVLTTLALQYAFGAFGVLVVLALVVDTVVAGGVLWYGRPISRG